MGLSTIDHTTLVLGGTGKTGRRVVQRLQALGEPVRMGSRSGEPPFNWSDRATWRAALQDVRAVYVTYYPDLALPGAAEDIQAFVDLARDCDMPRIILLSGRGEPEAQHCEQIVRESDLEWTVLRASWFSQNFSESYLLESILRGEVALPAGDVGEPFVDAEDIADIAVAALTDDRHVGQLYELTGSWLWTFEDAIGEIARVTRRQIRYVEVSMQEYTSALEHAGLPPEQIGLTEYLFKEVLDGRNSRVTDGITRALGRLPRDFNEYVLDTAASGVWNATAGDPHENVLRTA